jgi:hypothetical protein
MTLLYSSDVYLGTYSQSPSQLGALYRHETTTGSSVAEWGYLRYDVTRATSILVAERSLCLTVHSYHSLSSSPAAILFLKKGRMD